jgi:small subunit ribosomal protein S6
LVRAEIRKEVLMNIYEQIVILDPTLAEEEIETASSKIKDLISRSGGEVLKEDRWGRRKLAYEINKRSEGHFILYNFKSPSQSIKKLEDFYRVYDPVFKYMVIRLDKKQASALLEELTKSSETTAQETSSGE